MVGAGEDPQGDYASNPAAQGKKEVEHPVDGSGSRDVSQQCAFHLEEE